jgi:hypothetical protein
MRPGKQELHGLKPAPRTPRPPKPQSHLGEKNVKKMYYGLQIDTKKQVLFELLGIVPLTDEIRKLILKGGHFFVEGIQKYDYVRYDGKQFYFYSKEYLEMVDVDEFIENVARMMK